jgi:hypothetical protein
MEKLAEQLIEIATDLATDAKGKASVLQKQLAEIEAEKRATETALTTANLALQRLSSFVSIRGGDLQCPRCWIYNENVAGLRPIGGGTKTVDKFRCDECEQEFELTF